MNFLFLASMKTELWVRDPFICHLLQLKTRFPTPLRSKFDNSSNLLWRRKDTRLISVKIS